MNWKNDGDLPKKTGKQPLPQYQLSNRCPFLRVLTLVQSLSILLFALRVNGATTQETASFMPIISNLLALYCKSEGLLLVISAMNNNYARVATGKVTCAIQAVTPIATCLT